MILYPPLASARFFGWHHQLTGLTDFNRCISQRFGDNPATYAQFGLNGHNGIDVPCNRGTSLLSSHDGVVSDAYIDNLGGYWIEVFGNQGATYFKTIYGHEYEFGVSKGQQVKAGARLAPANSTGFSTGDHLHWGLKLTDNQGKTLNPNNGFHGAIDPLPFIVWFKEMFELWQATGSGEVWLVKGGKRTHVYNQGALLAISDFSQVKQVPQSQLDALPDSGVDLATLIKE